MGLHGSATCVMRFDEARSWIVGDAGRGLNAMFAMMNAARLHVALQGIGLLDAAWQKADAYSRERREMRAPGRGKSAAQADLIAEHPAMRRILDTQRAWIDGGRVLAYRTAVELDMVKHHPDAARREAAQRWCSLVTPVIKAAFTQQAFYGGSECLQVFGGHAYVREWGVEQNVRDARVAMIYEGTNEIQAIDLLVRKILPDGGVMFFGWLDTLRTNLDPGQAPDARVLDHLAALEVHTRQLVTAAASQEKGVRSFVIASNRKIVAIRFFCPLQSKHSRNQPSYLRQMASNNGVRARHPERITFPKTHFLNYHM